VTLPGEEPGQEQGLIKPFLGHLDDLRRVLVWSAGALFCGMVAAVFLVPRMFALLKLPLVKAGRDPETLLVAMDMTGGVSAAMQAVFWGGLLFSAPFILGCIAWFIFPGLTARERRAVTGGLVFAAILFIFGVLLGYFLALPPGIQMMLWVYEWMGFPIKFISLTSYVGFVLKLLLAFGLTFELPIVLLVLGHLGMVTSAQLRDKRRHAIVIILVIAMVITPTQDPVTQLLLSVPLVALYELCIWLIWAAERRKKALVKGDS
jgi:sec-independent protein translocase protein TatC